MANTKSSIIKSNLKVIKYLSKIHDWKTFENDSLKTPLNVLHIKKWEYVLLMFQKLTWIVKNK